MSYRSEASLEHCLYRENVTHAAFTLGNTCWSHNQVVGIVDATAHVEDPLIIIKNTDKGF